MRKEILCEREIGKDLITLEYAELEDFLESTEFGRQQGALLYFNECIYDDKLFWDWIYTKDNASLNDIKKEILYLFRRIESISELLFSEKEDNIGKNNNTKIFLVSTKKDVYSFWTVYEYLCVVRKYLSMEKKSDFVNDLAECFPRLYFVSDIGTSINSLNRKFEEIREEIVEHLSSLDGYQQTFSKMVRDGKSNIEMGDAFKRDTNIDCSPQANRNAIKELKLCVFNDITQQSEEIICELHTKFRKYNINRARQDRTYFHPGKEGVKEGRIIVKHIGSHM